MLLIIIELQIKSNMKLMIQFCTLIFFVLLYIYNMEVNVMDNSTLDGILFYSIDGKLIDNLSLNNNVLDNKKEIKTSKEFNIALKKVTQKDINFLQNKVINIIKNIKKNLAMNNTFIQNEIDDDIKNIDNIINDVEGLISKLIIDKNSIKIGIFSSNKKAKKQEAKNLEKSINYLSKSLNDIISIKNEYNKLIDRTKSIDELQIDDKEEEKQKEDPLERTINFYMKRQS